MEAACRGNTDKKGLFRLKRKKRGLKQKRGMLALKNLKFSVKGTSVFAANGHHMTRYHS